MINKYRNTFPHSGRIESCLSAHKFALHNVILPSHNKEINFKDKEINFKDKIINSRCVCDQGLGWINDQLIMLEPCEHIFHRKCINFLKCPICNSNIDNIYTEKQVKQKIHGNSKYYQKYVDMVCMKNTDKLCKKNFAQFTANLPAIMDIISRMPFCRGFDDGYKLCETVFSLAKVKLTVIGKNNIIHGKNMVIIANHTSIMDFMVMFHVFKCGFLASSSIKDTWLGKLVADIIPILFIDRGKDENTVDRMKKYVEKNGSLCIFPEGIIVHPETLARFRTGAFHVDKPILPVVINYKPYVSDSSISDFLQKLASQSIIDITINILPPEYPPFSGDKIESIRKKMAKKGNMALSRISNRDVVDKKK